jgi:hypothetical protein
MPLFLPGAGRSRLDHFEQARGIEWFTQKIDGTLIEGFPSEFSAIVDTICAALFPVVKGNFRNAPMVAARWRTDNYRFI